MNLFRRLAKNIFFKIVLSIVGLSFVLFGISDFITGMPNSWVLKIDNEKFSVNSFEKAVELDRKVIRSVKGSTPEIENYLNSEKFKSDVANRLTRKVLIQKISNEIGAFGSKKLILKTVAEDTNFQDKDGKFDHEKFSNFLKNNGLDEERYIQEVSNEVSAEMMKTLSERGQKEKDESQINLTDREKEILRLIAQEFSNAKISEKLFISERTVESHRKNIFRKTNTKTIVGLIKYAMENKLV